MANNYIERNPAEPTRTPTPKVKRERLLLEQFEIIRDAATAHSEWAANACGLALVTGQRREDVSLFRFSDIRDSTELKFGPNPPPFHEIRSLASRLCERERGEDFAQRLLGHKNLTMTQKYLDARGAEYVMV